MAEVIILAREQGAHQEDRGIDAGKLDVAETLAAFHVEEMIEETLIAARAGRLWSLQRVPEKAQRGQRQLARFCPRAPAALDTDRVGGKCKTDRGDARERRARPAIGHQSVLAV